MTIHLINTGTSANSGNGDSIRTAFNKVNNNFQSLTNSITDIDTQLNVLSVFNLDNDLAVSTHLIPSQDQQFDLGNPTHQWRSLYVSTSTIFLGNIPLSIDENGQLTINNQPITADTTSTFGTVTLTNNPFIYEPFVTEPVLFEKTDYGNEEDLIDTNLAITRGNNQGIYNPLLEPRWDDSTRDGISPKGTVWNLDGWDDLTNLQQRRYFTFYQIYDGNIGNNIIGSNPIMYDQANDTYYKFEFTVWTRAWQGAAVTYTRTQLDPITGEPIGDPVVFEKPAFGDPAEYLDEIDQSLTLTRGTNQGLYNAELEDGWDDQGDGYNSPQGTLWNAEGWNNLQSVTQREFVTFLEALDNSIGTNVVGRELVMWDTMNNRYYAIKFSSWTSGGNGGGFAYSRQLINTSNLFVKPDNTIEIIDVFVEDDGEGAGIGITRNVNGSIYNPYRESSWNSSQSPAGTLWNTDGWDNLTNITQRRYRNFYDVFNGNLGDRVPGTKCIMYIPETQQYWAIQFISWKAGGGGGFSYLRYLIDLTQLTQGITFADQSVLKSATGIGPTKSTASRNRKIEEVVGSNTVELSAFGYTRLTSTVTRTENNTSIIWIPNGDPITSILSDVFRYVDSTDEVEWSLNDVDWYRWNGGSIFSQNDRGYVLQDNPQISYQQGDVVYFRYVSGGRPVVWWDKNKLPSGSQNFRGAVIDYHAYTGDATWIGTIHIVDDSGSNHITHTEVSSGSNNAQNDNLWIVRNEGKIAYRRSDGESRTLKIHWTARVFYGSEYYD
jgi:hypothetical protein